ncbi:MAG: hypothetical protein IPM07_25025 [Anaerolineales bacterium]|jgi:hypothetical protein|nr:hypothetical protein [Anaerolineales bacterium]
MQENLTGRPALGTVLAVTGNTATVRLFLPGGGVVEETLPAVGGGLLAPGATVVAVFLSEAPASGVVVGALDGAALVAPHTHDERYYTEGEVNDLLAGKANAGHGHDERYYTEGEVNDLLTGKANAGHGHPDLVPWSLFDGAVRDFVTDYLVDSPTATWQVVAAGLQATAMGVRSVTQAVRDALGASEGAVVYNRTSGKFEGRTGTTWVVLG